MIAELNRRKRSYGTRRLVVCSIITLLTGGLFVYLLTANEDANTALLFILCFIAVCSLLIGLTIFSISRSSVTKKFDDFCSKTSSPSTTLTRLEQTWRNGTDFKYGKIDNEYIIAIVRNYVKIFPLSGVVWVHGMRQSINFIPVSSHFYINYREGKRKTLTFSGYRSKYLDILLNYVFDNCPNVYVGNDLQIGKLFKAKNWDELSRYAQMQRQA